VLLQADGGVFLHLQDPNGDYLRDEELSRRIKELARYKRPFFPGWAKRLIPHHRIARTIRKLSGTQNYFDKVNDNLLINRVIKTSLTPHEMWTITDIHSRNGKGVSLTHLAGLLEAYRLVAKRSYGFFGKELCELPEEFRAREEKLFAYRSPSGRHIGAVWKRR
jgi:hypothetical protein